MSRGHEALGLVVGMLDELDRGSATLRALIAGQRAHYPELARLLDRGRVLREDTRDHRVVSPEPREGLVWCFACEAIHLPETETSAAPQSTGERRTS